MPRHAHHARVTARKELRASGEATRGGDGRGMLGRRNGTPRLAKRHSAGSARRDRSHTPPRPGPPQHGMRQGDDEAPASPWGGAGGPPLPTPPPAPRTTPPTAVTRGGRWEQETTPPLGLGHLRQPGALQGHHGGPGATRSARPGGEQRGVGTALPMAGRAAHHTKPRKASESVRCVRGPRSHRHREAERGRAGSGRSPHTPPRPPRTATAGGGGGGARRARGQNEKSGPIRHECPSLV